MNANNDHYVIGVDFGTLSGRAVVVRVSDGAEVGSAVHEYAHRVIEDRLPGTDVKLGPDWALQSPQDWREVLRTAVPEAVAASGISPSQVIGLGTDFTACTVLPATAGGTPCARSTGWPSGRTPGPSSGSITPPSRTPTGSTPWPNGGASWLPRYGGKISSEWQFAKGLQVLEEDPEVYGLAERWIEAADWIIWQLTGVESRNTCTAGYKGSSRTAPTPPMTSWPSSIPPSPVSPASSAGNWLHSAASRAV
nr:hypothetical protein GCM10020093_002290 [Planobispora longispora]